jgi:Na+/H+ antiporter NhaD/arsenite permease-like protein
LVVLSIVPLAGSFITEPAAMTLAAILLRDAYFRASGRAGFKYMTLGVLFVNVSIGGVLTSYAAPPVLMVASTFGWDAAHMATHFGWRAAVAVFINAGVLTFVCRQALLNSEQATQPRDNGRPAVPVIVIAVHLIFLVGVVLSAHHPAIFLGLLMLFIGFTEAYKRHQNRLMIKEGLMVGFFLAGLVVLGGLQQWWLQDLLGGLSPIVLFWGATALTAITDNAALTYLGSLVQGTDEVWRYMLVAGAVTGGGLTVIANAPNPAGFAILKNHFPDGSISAGRLFIAALLPTLVAAGMFLLPV